MSTERKLVRAEKLIGRAASTLTMALVRRKLTRAAIGDVISSLEQALVVLKEVYDANTGGSARTLG